MTPRKKKPTIRKAPDFYRYSRKEEPPRPEPPQVMPIPEEWKTQNKGHMGALAFFLGMDKKVEE